MKTPDKLLAAIRAALKKPGWHPLLEMAKDVDQLEAGDPTRTALLNELAKYLQAKPAAVDGEGNVAPVLRVEIATWAGGVEEPKRLKSAKPDADD